MFIYQTVSYQAPIKDRISNEINALAQTLAMRPQLGLPLLLASSKAIKATAEQIGGWVGVHWGTPRDADQQAAGISFRVGYILFTRRGLAEQGHDALRRQGFTLGAKARIRLHTIIANGYEYSGYAVLVAMTPDAKKARGAFVGAGTEDYQMQQFWAAYDAQDEVDAAAKQFSGYVTQHDGRVVWVDRTVARARDDENEDDREVDFLFIDRNAADGQYNGYSVDNELYNELARVEQEVNTFWAHDESRCRLDERARAKGYRVERTIAAINRMVQKQMNAKMEKRNQRFWAKVAAEDATAIAGRLADQRKPRTQGEQLAAEGRKARRKAQAQALRDFAEEQQEWMEVAERFGYQRPTDADA